MCYIEVFGVSQCDVCIAVRCLCVTVRCLCVTVRCLCVTVRCLCVTVRCLCVTVRCLFQSFWDYLFSTALQWGLVVYEQVSVSLQLESVVTNLCYKILMIMIMLLNKLSFIINLFYYITVVSMYEVHIV